MPQRDASTSEPQRVVIIGAGFAGLSAAYHLLQQQQSSEQWNIQIIEARDRVGGRVHPCRWDDRTVVDFGGQWLHEASERNPLVPVLRDELKIPLLYSQLEEEEKASGSATKRVSKSLVYDRTTGDAIPKNVYQAASRFFYKTMKKKNQVSDPKDTSFQAILDAAMSSPGATGTRFGGNDDFLKVINYLIHRTECYEGGRFRELSVAMDDVYENLGGPDEYPVGGYDAVLRSLMDTHIGRDRVSFDTIVDTIKYEEEGESTKDPVTITCRDGSSIMADYCICTIPLGVLQKRRVTFDPPLSEKRWKAIDAIGMGLLDKVLLQFEHKFWDDNAEWFATSDADIRLVQNFADCTSDFGSPVLGMFVGGDAARRFDDPTSDETLSDEEVIEEALQSLRSIFGDDKVGKPVRTHVTRWLSDPFALGAYSFFQTGSSEESYRTVAKPCHRLLFAGEHTSLRAHSCVHGAWETGKREADRIVQMHCGRTSTTKLKCMP